jgi:hypothetical protein
MPAEATCVSQPSTVIPLVVKDVQGFIATGQVRSTDQLIDLQQFRQPGTVLVTLEPIYEGGLAGVLPGSSCIANATALLQAHQPTYPASRREAGFLVRARHIRSDGMMLW